MAALPLIVSLLVAALVVPTTVHRFPAAGLSRANHRGVPVAAPTGITLAVVVMIALGPLALLAELADADVFFPDVLRIVAFVLGVSALGFLDDVASWSSPSEPSRRERSRSAAAREEHPTEEVPPAGAREQTREAAGGRPPTGLIKVLGTIGLALFVLIGQGRSGAGYLVAAAVLVLATNFFNLLDLRPGRSIKLLLLLGLALLIGEWNLDSLWTLGLFLGAVVLLLPIDLRERGMLGNAGSMAVGALAGWWLVLTLANTGLAIALVVLAATTLYAEFRSLSALMERTPGLRELDSLGRAPHA